MKPFVALLVMVISVPLVAPPVFGADTMTGTLAPNEAATLLGMRVDDNILTTSVTTLKPVYGTNEPITLRIVLENTSNDDLVIEEIYPRSVNVAFGLPDQCRHPADPNDVGYWGPSDRIKIPAKQKHIVFYPLDQEGKFTPGQYKISFRSLVQRLKTSDDMEPLFLRSPEGEFIFERSKQNLSAADLGVAIDQLIENSEISKRALGQMLLWFAHPKAAKQLVELAKQRAMPTTDVLKAIRSYPDKKWVSAETIGDLILHGAIREALEEGMETLWQRQDPVPRTVVETIVKDYNRERPTIIVDYYLKHKIRDHLDLIQTIDTQKDPKLAQKIKLLLNGR